MKRLKSSESYFLIHVDSRQDYLYRELARLTASQPNIRMASKRKEIKLGNLADYINV